MNKKRLNVYHQLRYAVTAVLLVCLLCYGQSQETQNLTKLQILRSQLETVNKQLDDAQKQLSKLPNPNWCCCAAAFVLAPVIGGVFWYFVDIRPKENKRRQLEQRISTLTAERQTLLAQITLLEQQ